jgi:hypothetical protein
MAPALLRLHEAESAVMKRPWLRMENTSLRLNLVQQSESLVGIFCGGDAYMDKKRVLVL